MDWTWKNSEESFVHEDFWNFSMADLHIISIFFFSFITHPWSYFKWFLWKIVKLDKQFYDLLLSMALAILYHWKIWFLANLIWRSILSPFYAPLILKSLDPKDITKISWKVKCNLSVYLNKHCFLCIFVYFFINKP